MTSEKDATNELLLCLPPTDLLFMTYEGNWILECDSTVLDVVETELTGGNPPESNVVVVLDRTVMHPQGGGQPTDMGKLVMIQQGRNVAPDNMGPNVEGVVAKTTLPTIVLEVSKVDIDRSNGVVRHIGRAAILDSINVNLEEKSTNHLEGENRTTGMDETTVQLANDHIQQVPNVRLFEVGDRVTVTVDADRRRILSECHTAGHVVDAAMARCGYCFKSGKAYHFLEGPYVEYTSAIGPAEFAAQRDTLLSSLQCAFAQLVQENIPTSIDVLSLAEADALCNPPEQNRSAETRIDTSAFRDRVTDQVRVVTVAGYACPCGGTHVHTTGDLALRQWGITALQCKKGIFRVKYGQGLVLNP